ncbi:MAG: hypothetical protein IIC83_12815, partial [Chloroflexi bacterium]|nr:hypothetical protein [Chloroflexota bacterium]
NVWAVGTGNLIIKSTDGGASWAQQETITTGETLKGIFLNSDRSGLAAGSGGRVWKYGPTTP